VVRRQDANADRRRCQFIREPARAQVSLNARLQVIISMGLISTTIKKQHCVLQCLGHTTNTPQVRFTIQAYIALTTPKMTPVALAVINAFVRAKDPPEHLFVIPQNTLDGPLNSCQLGVALRADVDRASTAAIISTPRAATSLAMRLSID
jgi:hypothetical protein